MGKKVNWTGERLETHVFNETTIEHLHRYVLAMQFIAGKKVLDIACGEGYGANLMADAAQTVVGIDIDQASIQQAAGKYKKDNLRFANGPIEEIPCGANEFDVVTCFETIEHVSDHAQVMTELKRVLHENGLLILSTPDKKTYSDLTGYKNAFHKKELYKDDLLKLAGKHFRHCRLCYQSYTGGSFILQQDAGTELKLYTGSYGEVHPVSGLDHTYFVVFCSDAALPPIHNSFFDHRLPVHSLLKQKEKEITGTITYRLGHILLYPFKFIRQLFRK